MLLAVSPLHPSQELSFAGALRGCRWSRGTQPSEPWAGLGHFSPPPAKEDSKESVLGVALAALGYLKPFSLELQSLGEHEVGLKLSFLLPFELGAKGRSPTLVCH